MVGDVLVDLELLVHVLFDDARQVRLALDAAKGRALPLAARDELEWPRADFLACRSDANDGRNTPALRSGDQQTCQKAGHDKQ